MIQAVNISQLLSQDQLKVSTNWASGLSGRLSSLGFPQAGEFMVSLGAHRVVFRFQDGSIDVAEFKEGKTRSAVLAYVQNSVKLNGRLAQKEDLKAILSMLKSAVILGKQGGVQGGEGMRWIVALGKTIHRFSEGEGSSVIASFIEKTKQLFLGMRANLKRLVINNDSFRPKPSLGYQLAIDAQEGGYLERSHFVRNHVSIDFLKLGMTINEQPITQTGCTWFSDRLGNLTKDVAGGRAEVFEG